MICFSICDKCKHQRENIDGWLCACDAFPEGQPKGFIKSDKDKDTECNNGIKFEIKDK